MKHALLLTALLLAACSDPPCQVPAPGACKTDADCVLARCVDVDCPGCGSPVAVSQLQTQACLIAVGTTPRDSCLPLERRLPVASSCTASKAFCPNHAVFCRDGVCAGAREGSFPDGGPI